MKRSWGQWWSRMPSLIRLVFIISLLECLTAAVDVVLLLTSRANEVGQSRLSPWIGVAGVLIVFGALAYGIGMEHRYPRLLAIAALTAQPFTRSDFSWRVILSSLICLGVAAWFLYWDDAVTDYYIILRDRAHERRRAAI
jgi:hypothetical protein